MKCDLCDCEAHVESAVCGVCGYGFQDQEVVDEAKIRKWITEGDQGWVNEATRVKKVHAIQVAKHGEKGRNPGKKNAPGWSMRDTAKLLGKSHTHVADDIILAKGLEKKPWLRECKNRTAALQQSKKTAREPADAEGPPVFTSEVDLQRYLETKWEETALAAEWKLQAPGKYNTQEVGEIDFLARHKDEPVWLVLELKVARSTDVAVGQLLRYMGWVKLRLAQESEKIKGFIICASADDTIRYALACVPQISLYRYSVDEGRLDFIQEHIARTRNERTQDDLLLGFEQLTSEEQLEIIRRLSEGGGSLPSEEGIK